MDMQRLLILRGLPEALKAFRSDKDFEGRLVEALRTHLSAGPRDSLYYQDRGTEDGQAFVIYLFNRADPSSSGICQVYPGDECLYRVPYAVTPGGALEFSFGAPEKVRERRDYVPEGEIAKAGPVANRPGLALDPTSHRWKKTEIGARPGLTLNKESREIVHHDEAPNDAAAAAYEHQQAAAGHAEKVAEWVKKSREWPRREDGSPVNATAYKKNQRHSDKHGEAWAAHHNAMTGHLHGSAAPGESDHAREKSKHANEWSAANGFGPAEALKAGPVANRPGMTLDPMVHRWKRSEALATQHRAGGNAATASLFESHARALRSGDHLSAKKAEDAIASADHKPSDKYLFDKVRAAGGDVEEAGRQVKRDVPDLAHAHTGARLRGMAERAHQAIAEQHRQAASSIGDEWDRMPHEHAADAHEAAAAKWATGAKDAAASGRVAREYSHAASSAEALKAKAKGDNLTLDMFGGGALAAAKPAATEAAAAVHVGATPGDPTHGGRLVAQKVTDKAGHQTTRYKKTGEAAHPLAHLQKMQPGDQTTVNGVRLHVSTPIGHGTVPHIHDTEAGRELGPRDDPKTLDKVAEHVQKPRDTIPGTPESIRKMHAALKQQEPPVRSRSRELFDSFSDSTRQHVLDSMRRTNEHEAEEQKAKQLWESVSAGKKGPWWKKAKELWEAQSTREHVEALRTMPMNFPRDPVTGDFPKDDAMRAIRMKHEAKRAQMSIARNLHKTHIEAMDGAEEYLAEQKAGAADPKANATPQALHPNTAPAASTPAAEYGKRSTAHGIEASDHSAAADELPHHDQAGKKAHWAAADAHREAARLWGAAKRAPSQEAESAAHYATDRAKAATAAAGTPVKAKDAQAGVEHQIPPATDGPPPALSLAEGHAAAAKQHQDKADWHNQAAKAPGAATKHETARGLHQAAADWHTAASKAPQGSPEYERAAKLARQSEHEAREASYRAPAPSSGPDKVTLNRYGEKTEHAVKHSSGRYHVIEQPPEASTKGRSKHFPGHHSVVEAGADGQAHVARRTSHLTEHEAKKLADDLHRSHPSGFDGAGSNVDKMNAYVARQQQAVSASAPSLAKPVIK